MSKRWYIVHAYSGFEKQVMRSLQERIRRSGMEHVFGEVLVPTEEVVEMKNGVKRKSERKFFPGYVLVHMEMNDDTWHLVKDCPKVMGFIGGKADKPAPITDREADAILSRLRQNADAPRPARMRRVAAAMLHLQKVADGVVHIALDVDAHGLEHVRVVLADVKGVECIRSGRR